jgi:hypothetical protein
MKKRVIISVLFFSCFFLHAEGGEYLIGLEKGWQELNLSKQAIFKSGYQGYNDIQIEDSEYAQDGNTELLLHFNGTPAPENWAYSCQTSDSFGTATFAKLGQGSALFKGTANKLVYKGDGTALFSPGTQLKDFSLEFWLYPVTLGEGETIFEWRGNNPKAKGFEEQSVTCEIYSRKLVWTFKNWFMGPKGFLPFVKLVSSKELLPKTWKHHLLRFDSATAMVEYAVNGIPEAIAYATPSGKETGEVYLPYCGMASESKLVIGSQFTGFMDELRLSKVLVDRPSLDTKGDKYAEVRTRIIDLGTTGTLVNAIQSRFVAPGYSSVEFYYKAADQRTNIIELTGNWKPFVPGQDLFIRARYIQVLALLYPDGSNSSPRLSFIKIQYEKASPPAAPTGVMAEGLNGAVRLSWNKVYSPGVLGYKIYYGEKPGQYLGSESLQGPSPIDAGNVLETVITGLKNGRLYYFAVVAYDSPQADHMSAFSAETAARPTIYGGEP